MESAVNSALGDGWSPRVYKKDAAVGLAVCVGGALLTAYGLVVQQQEKDRNPVGQNLMRRGRYMFGLGCVGLGVLASVLNDGLLPQSTLAPLAAQTIVYKSLLAFYVLREPLPTVQKIALACMSVGMLVSLCGANLEDGVYTLRELLVLFEQPSSLLYTAVAGLMLFVCRRVLKHCFDNDFSSACGLMYLTLASGMIAGWSGTLIKAVVELSITSIWDDTGDFGRVGTYVFLLLIPWLVSLKLKYVSLGLANYESEYFMPLYQSIVIACNAICGLFYFADFDRDVELTSPPANSGTASLPLDTDDDGTTTVAPKSNLTVFMIGTGLTILGVLIMFHKTAVSPQRKPPPSRDWAGKAFADGGSDAAVDEPDGAEDEALLSGSYGATVAAAAYTTHRGFGGGGGFGDALYSSCPRPQPPPPPPPPPPPRSPEASHEENPFAPSSPNSPTSYGFEPMQGVGRFSHLRSDAGPGSTSKSGGVSSYQPAAATRDADLYGGHYGSPRGLDGDVGLEL